MARQYTSTNVSTYFELFGVPQASASIQLTILMNQWQSYISNLQTALTVGHTKAIVTEDTQWGIDKKQFIRNTIVDSFAPFLRYDYRLNLSAIQRDETTGFDYQVVTVTTEIDEDREWTLEDVGSDAFATVFKAVTNTDIADVLVPGIPSKIVNNIAFTVYQNALPLYKQVANKIEPKKSTVTAVLIWADEYDDWLFKVSNDTLEGICANFKAYLTERKKQ